MFVDLRDPTRKGVGVRTSKGWGWEKVVGTTLRFSGTDGDTQWIGLPDHGGVPVLVFT